MEGLRDAYKSLVRKSEGKRLLRIPRHRWEDNIRMDHREMRWKGMDWIHLAQLLGSIKGGEFLDQLSDC